MRCIAECTRHVVMQHGCTLGDGTAWCGKHKLPRLHSSPLHLVVNTYLQCTAPPRSNQQLLGVEVCLDPSSKSEPKAIDCPANRASAVDSQPGVTECNGTVTMRIGVEVGLEIVRCSCGEERAGQGSC